MEDAKYREVEIKMGFEPGIEIGKELTNDEIRKLFQCGNMGGMRRSKRTNTLVIISDDTKTLYRDVWINGVLHYTGMGKVGDQVLEGNQNKTLYYSNVNGVELHLFEVMEKTVYTYRGVVTLVDKPYQTVQLDDNKNERKVWMFPIKPIVEVDAYSTESLEKELIKLTNRELNRRFEMNNQNREPKETVATIYYRDPYLKEMVKRIAEGKCQYCGADAPFKDKNKEPYLEEHHVKRLADGGKDTIDNVVAVCPNCHRKMHILKEEKDIRVLTEVAKQNKSKLSRLLAYKQKYNEKDQSDK